MYCFIHMIQDLPSGEMFSAPLLTSSFIATIAGAQDLSKVEDQSYATVPRSTKAIAEDQKLLAVCKWHRDWARPDNLSDKEYATFLRYCTEFFPDHDRLWQKDSQGAHKLVITTQRRL